MTTDQKSRELCQQERAALITTQVRDAAITVRLARYELARIDRVVAWAVARGRNDLTRSSIIRDAIHAFLPALADLVEQGREVKTARTVAAASNREPETAYTESIRLRIDSALVDQLDAVEAVARGRRRRDITRSNLIRYAVESYVDGLEDVLSDEISGPSASDPSTKTASVSLHK